jgi:hypothetical protein
VVFFIHVFGTSKNNLERESRIRELEEKIRQVKIDEGGPRVSRKA